MISKTYVVLINAAWTSGNLGSRRGDHEINFKINNLDISKSHTFNLNDTLTIIYLRDSLYFVNYPNIYLRD